MKVLTKNLFMCLMYSLYVKMSYEIKIYFKEKIKEELPPGTVVLRLVSAEEINTMTNILKSKVLEFVLLDSFDSRYFTCNKHTSLITTQVRLDRELLCADPDVKNCCDPKSSDPELCLLQFQVTAKSDLEIQLIQIVVEVEDINDNLPTFLKTQETIFVKENSKLGEIQRLKVRDSDSKMYSTKSVLLKANNVVNEYFSIHLDSGQVKIILKKHLDREKIDQYSMVIIAVDGGDNPNSGSIVVNINVTDINDNSPKWITENFTVSLKEDTPINSLILHLQADDKDFANNGKISYELDNFKSEEEMKLRNIFHLVSWTGELRLQQRLDYESLSTPEIKLIVFAKDNGEEIIHSISATVTIRVIDVNDNPPTIIATSLSSDKLFKVKENVASQQQVASISVSDPDTGKGGEVNCDIDSKIFQLNPLNNPLTKGFSLVSQSSMDREDRHTHIVTITCSDMGNPQLSSTRVISVIVTDDNDNQPTFQMSVFQFKVYENNVLGQFIGTVNATDRDIDGNGQITYTLSRDAENIVSIDSFTGALSADKEFDRELVDKYSFTVYARDNGKPSLSSSASVNLIILDMNDHSPVFENTYFFPVLENSYPGTAIGKVEAVDKDLGENARITYQLLGRFHQFGIDQITGKIVLRSGTLDREKVANYDLKVMATDHGQPSRRGQASVHIVVEDVNDNPPVFIFPSSNHNQVNVSCNETPNQVIARIIANDSDYGQNKDISYVILPFPVSHSNNFRSSSSNYQNLFDIDSHGGQLFLINKFPTCSFSYEIKVPIRAVDHGATPLSATSYLIVNVNSDISRHITNLPWSPEKKSHWTAIISLVVATAVLISLLFIILCLLKRKYALRSPNYRKGQTKPDFSHVVERPGANDSGKVTSDEEEPSSNTDYRTMGTYIGFPSNYYTVATAGQKLNNTMNEPSGRIFLRRLPQKNDLNNDKSNYQTLSANSAHEYSPLSIERNFTPKFDALSKNITFNINKSEKATKEVNSDLNALPTTSQISNEDTSETIANPMVSTYCSVSFV